MTAMLIVVYPCMSDSVYYMYCLSIKCLSLWVFVIPYSAELAPLEQRTTSLDSENRKLVRECQRLQKVNNEYTNLLNP